MTTGLIGGVGLTLLQVYDQGPGPDGVKAGCAHVHGLTDDAYFGVGGEGAVELHDLENGFRSVPISKGTFVQFPPWTLHRSVSHDGLEVLAMMGNQGLAERGDARVFFGGAADADPERYDRLKALVAEGSGGALERRDRSAEAYVELMDQWHNDRPAYQASLERFFACHHRTIEATPDLAAWRDKGGSEDASAVGSVGQWSASDANQTYGMCGILRQIESLSAG